MKKKCFFLALACCLLTLTSFAEEKAEFRYVDATQFRIINKGWDNTAEPYVRLRAQMKDTVRSNQWWLYTHSSGIAIRFATNSKRIAAHYNIKYNFHMQHMAMTGIKGTDLYYLNEETNVWEHVNTNRPQEPNFKVDSIQNKVYVENLDGKMHEWMFYLPLYDGINWFQIGVDSTATITYPQIENPRKGKIVCYGTSIMQGGCASRTGMVSTSMIQRDFNFECVNLATSGEGKMDFYMAREMATIEDAICYVLDPIPNCTEMMCDTLTYDFVNILRKLRPEVPIIMVEGPMYPYARHDSFFKNYLPAKNAAWRKNYDKLKAENPKNLYYVPCDGLTGPNMDGTVEGIHFTDYGFRAYADILEPYIKQALEDQGKDYNLVCSHLFMPYTETQEAAQKSEIEQLKEEIAQLKAQLNCKAKSCKGKACKCNCKKGKCSKETCQNKCSKETCQNKCNKETCQNKCNKK